MLKVGDRVRVRKDLKGGIYCGRYYVTYGMVEHAGKEEIVTEVINNSLCGGGYKLASENGWVWSGEMLEKVETGIPALTVLEYLETKQRMCRFKDSNCGICELENCCDLEMPPCEAIKIVKKWGEEHPSKTYLSDFLEKYPHSTLYGWDEIPTFCPCELGYFERYECDKDCVKCWNQEMGVEE